jgi:hypothetical protein
VAPSRDTSLRGVAAVFALLVLLVAGVALLPGHGKSVNRALARADVKPAVRVQHFRFFSPHGFWNAPIAEESAVDPDSKQIVAALDRTVSEEQAQEVGPWINTTSYNVPIYRVPWNQPTVTVHLAAPYAEPALREAWKAVPLPPEAEPAPGNDAHLVVWQPAADRMWEFWHLRKSSGGWEAGWGGAMDEVSTNPGVYTAAAWPGATTFWGASASSLPLVGGLITLEDMSQGWINHALAISVPDVRADVYARPARRTDGSSSDPLSLPEGAHLRLAPGLDLSTLQLPPITLRIAEAAQRYGIYVRDGAKTVSFYAQAPKSPDRDPYAGKWGYFEGMSAREVLAPFPWDRLQLLKMDLRTFDNYQHRAP